MRRRPLALVKSAAYHWAVSEPGKTISRRVTAAFNDLRCQILQSSLKRCGSNFSIQLPAHFSQPEMIEIGDDVSIAAYVHIWGAGNVRIGNRVMIGSHSAITSVTHDHSVDPMRDSVVLGSVIIEDDVWVGAHAVILPGVTIRSCAVVGAGSVVTHDVPARAIVAGVPARVARMRDVK